MKPKNIEKQAAVRSVVVSTLFQLVLAGCFLSFRTAVQTGWLRNLLLILVMGNLIIIPFSFAVLRQRVKEIERGELDEAKKY